MCVVCVYAQSWTYNVNIHVTHSHGLWWNGVEWRQWRARWCRCRRQRQTRLKQLYGSRKQIKNNRQGNWIWNNFIFISSFYCFGIRFQQLRFYYYISSRLSFFFKIYSRIGFRSRFIVCTVYLLRFFIVFLCVCDVCVSWRSFGVNAMAFHELANVWLHAVRRVTEPSRQQWKMPRAFFLHLLQAPETNLWMPWLLVIRK